MHRRRSHPAAVLLALATVLLSLALPAYALDVVPAEPGATDTAASFTATTAGVTLYDNHANLAPQAVTNHGRSSGVSRPVLGAMGHLLAFPGELHAPKGPLRLPASETWGRLDTLDDHFLRHGAGVGARTADEYAGMSSEFFQRGLRDGLPTKVDADGVIRIYDPATNTFGAFNATGTTRTFFTPKRGIDYWYDQPGSAPWGPGR